MSKGISRERISFVGYEVVDPALMDTANKETFIRRREAINLRLDGYTGSEIRKITGIQESEQTRLFKRYTTLNEKGVYLGEVGLIPRYRVEPYKRVKSPVIKHTESQGGLSGVLGYTLGKYPGIEEKFESEVLRKESKFGQGVKFSKKGLCQVFYDICKAEGVADDEWPLNQLRGARKTIGKYIDAILHSDFKRAALVSGGRIALTHSKVGTGVIPLLEDFDVYDFIEIDSWHIDAFFVLNISGDKRVKTKDVISRIWLIAAVCRRSNAVLAIKFVFSSEIRSQDLLDLICEAYAGTWAPRTTFNVRDLKYSVSAGIPCYSVPGLRHHIWGSTCLDNAMQHHASKVYELALHTLGFAINFGPLEQPARRPKIEGLFKRIATNAIHQIASTTGSNPQNGRAESPEEAAIYYQIDVDDALEVMDVLTANYNGTPQGGLNKANSPLDVLRAYCADKDTLLPKTHEVYLNSISLGSATAQARVTGSIVKGIRPRVKLDQAVYTSPDLANSSHLIGKQLLIRIDPHDYRTVEAYLPEGIYFGTLTVEAAWRNIKHSVTTRRLVNRAQSKKEFEIMDGESPILAWKRHLRENASTKSNRELARLSKEMENNSALAQPEPPAETPDISSLYTSERWKSLDILKRGKCMDYSHSLFSNDFRLNTPALLAVVQNVCFKVLMRKTGVVFTGEPRVGKTSCCEALVDEIPKRFPSVYVFMIPAVSVDSSGERYSSIIHQMLDLEEIKPGSRVTFIQRQSLLIERLLIRAAQARARQIVMLIDELQRLSAADFNQLADVYNKLRAKKVTLTVISFAMPSIDKKVVQFLDDDARHIIGRFLSDIRPMYGVTSLTQLTSILKLYDESSSYCGSEICYSSNILPKAYSCGFRISSLSENIWLEMSRIATGKYVNNLPMEHITQVILYLFVILSQGDKCGLVVPPDLIVEAIHESNFKAFCRSIGSKYGEK